MDAVAKPDDSAADSVVVSRRSGTGMPQRLVLGAGIVLAIVVAGGVWWWVGSHRGQTSKAANAATQKALDKNLTAAISAADEQAIVNDASQLIVGAKDGSYTISTDKLGWYYIDRADAYSTLKQYKQATPDYEKAASLNDSIKNPALQAEFEARYLSGERSQLIPLLQSIIQLEKKSQSPIHGEVVDQYQAYIQQIQQGKEISF